ncbi:mate-domain-containing protein [Fusarium avenaceum]|nr:mate-domain-containing protein [Fusarium avenaceum]
MGWHDRDAQQLFQLGDSWSKREEQRRTWWAIFVLDRFINIDTSGMPFAAPEPCPDELLPVNDEDWALGKTLSIEEQMSSTISSLSKRSLACAVAVCICAQALLYGSYGCPDAPGVTSRERLSHETEMQSVSVQGLRALGSSLAPKLVQVQSDCPLLARCFYTASNACAWFVREDYEPQMRSALMSLVSELRRLSECWGIAMPQHNGVLHNETSPLLPQIPEISENEASKSLTDVHSLWAEARLLCKYSLPLIATYLLQYSFTVITTIVAGRLGAEELAASSLALTTMNIIGFTIFEGMATALDTLCAQAYGSGRYTGVGMHIQRMLVFMAVVMLPVGAIWLCSHWILPLLVPQETLALKAASFLRVSLVGLPGYAFFEAGKRFLQAQGEFGPGMMVLIICAPVNAFLSWYFAVKLDMGLDGAAFGQALANNLRPALLLLYVMFIGKKSHRCWGGWDARAAFAVSEWGPMVRLSIASTAVNAAEWLAFEILMISTSYIDTRHLAAQTVLNTVSIVTWHVPFSISVAVTTRFGHLVGAGALKEARRAAILYSVVFVVVGIFDGAFLFLLRRPLANMFSDDTTVRDLATGSMLAVACFQIIDSVICGTNGVLRGLAKQSVAAWVVLAVNYLAAVPFAIWLELGSPDMKLDGLWIGLGSGMVVIAVIECAYMKWISWQDCVDDVKEREDDGT